MSKKTQGVQKYPRYNPPVGEIGMRNYYNWQSKSLRIYKIPGKHDSKWVYMYAELTNPFTKKPVIFATVIYDRFPKGAYHLLVLPTLISAQKPEQFNVRDLPMLKLCHQLALDIADALKKQHYNMTKRWLDFSVGYHAIPTMDDLHIHIVSNDFSTQYMKTIQKYNSFTDPRFFLDVGYVEEQLEEKGYMVILDSAYYDIILNQQPICMDCGFTSKNFDKFKEHNAKRYFE